MDTMPQASWWVTMPLPMTAISEAWGAAMARAGSMPGRGMAPGKP